MLKGAKVDDTVPPGPPGITVLGQFDPVAGLVAAFHGLFCVMMSLLSHPVGCGNGCRSVPGAPDSGSGVRISFQSLIFILSTHRLMVRACFGIPAEFCLSAGVFFNSKLYAY